MDAILSPLTDLAPMLAVLEAGGEGAIGMAWYLPILIFFGRICDVAIGTIRMILVIGGHPLVSAVLGFFEVVIWVLAVGGTLANLTNPVALVAYAGGFAVGVVVGMWIEQWMALGYRLIRAISTNMNINLSHHLREHGFRVTRVEGTGRTGPVELAFMVVKRRDINRVRSILAELDPNAFITIGQADRPTTARLGADSRFSRPIWLNGLRK